MPPTAIGRTCEIFLSLPSTSGSGSAAPNLNPDFKRFIMFKFDFDIDDAEEFDEITGVKASEPIQATAGDEAPVLESFSELPIHQLVRDLFRQQQLRP